MRLKKLAESRVRYGYRRLHTMLYREDSQVNHKRTYRLLLRPNKSPRLTRAQSFRLSDVNVSNTIT